MAWRKAGRTRADSDGPQTGLDSIASAVFCKATYFVFMFGALFQRPPVPYPTGRLVPSRLTLSAHHLEHYL